MTFDEIRIKTIRVAQNLKTRGYGRKQVFGFLAKNSHHLAPVVFGSLCLGCAVSTFDPSFGKIELLHMLNVTKPALMFCDVDASKMVKECLDETGNDALIFTFGGSSDCSECVENLLLETNNEKNYV